MNIAVCVAITIAVWPFRIGRPEVGVEGYALQQTFVYGLRAGRDYVFTYGPLGFIAVPRAWSWPLALVAAAYGTAAVAAIVGAVYFTWRRRTGTIVAAASAGAVALVTVGQDPAEVALVAMAALGYWCIDGSHSKKVAFWVPVALSVMAAIHLLVKFNVGLGGSVAAIASLLLTENRSLRRGLTAGLASVTAFLVAWLICDQHIADLPGWLRGSVSSSNGYSSAMSTGSLTQRVALHALAASILATLLLTTTIRYGRRPFPLSLTTAVLLLLAFKHAFVRPDPAHVDLLFIFFATLLPLALVRASGGTYAAMRAVTLILPLFIVASPEIGNLDRPLRASVASTLRSLDGSTRQKWERADRTRILDELHITPDVETLLRGRTVSVEPYEIAALWAITGVRWRPLATLASYSAYTPYLDDLNLAGLRSEQAPEFVLRLRQMPVDDRNPLWESPAYQVGLQCRYRPVLVRGDVEVLTRVPWRCTSPVLLNQIHSKRGVMIHHPEVGDGEFLVMHINAPIGAVEIIARKAFRAFSYTKADVDQQQRYRLVDATLQGPLLIRTPSGASGFFGRQIDYRTLTLSRDAKIRYEVFRLST